MLVMLWETFFLPQEYQKDIIKAAEGFTAIGYKHIEIGKWI